MMKCPFHEARVAKTIGPMLNWTTKCETWDEALMIIFCTLWAHRNLHTCIIHALRFVLLVSYPAERHRRPMPIHFSFNLLNASIVHSHCVLRLSLLDRQGTLTRQCEKKHTYNQINTLWNQVKATNRRTSFDGSSALAF